jgi:hypothetical protein
MPRHKSKPTTTGTGQFTIGSPPLSAGSISVSEQARHLLNWGRCGQIFSYMGPGPFDRSLASRYPSHVHTNPDYDFTGSPYFSIVTKSEEFTTLGNQLAGFVIPWRYQAGATIDWTASGGSPVNLFTAGGDSHDDIDAVRQHNNPTERIRLYNGLTENGVEGGGFSAHKLEYSGMMVAGLGIWAAPDMFLDSDRRLFDLEQFLSGRQVRGEDTSRAGLGNLIGDVQSILYRTGRCMLQSGHPLGVCTSSTSYVNLRHDASAFLVEPMGIYGGTDIACTPFIVAGAYGATEGAPAYVQFETVGSSDSYEFEITSDTEALYTAPGELDCYRYSEQVLISLKAPSGGAVYVRTYGIWEG